MQIPSHCRMVTNILYHVTNQGGQGGATIVQLTDPQDSGSPKTYSYNILDKQVQTRLYTVTINATQDC